MQRFARLEDLADLEDLTLRLPATTPNTDHGITSASFNSHNNRPSGEQFDPFEHVHERSEQGHMPIMNEQNERTRHYIGAHTTFLNSADTEGSGYIPPRLSATTGYTPHHQQRHYHDHIHADLSHPSSASRTPVHYPSSLTEEDGYTAPGTNDFDDEFLQDPILSEIDPSGVVAGAATVLAASVGGGLSSNDSGSFTDDTSGQQIHQHQRRKQPQSQREYPHNQHGIRQAVVEHYASSMVLPAWARAGFEEQGLHQEILVKNICIVDTPGYSAFSNPNRAMDLVISYLGLQFQTTNEFFSRSVVSDDSLGRFLANNSTGAHSHVDACLYVIEGALSEVDILFMQRLQSWVNLIPILIPSIDGIGYQDKAQLQNDNIGKGSTNSGGPAAVVTMAEAIERGRNELIRQLKEHDVHIYGIDDISCSSVEDQRSEHVSALSSSSSPLASVESPEAHLTSPPLLILEDNSSSRSSLHEFAAPPFIFHVPPSLMDEDTGVGQLDRDVMRLDVVTTQYSSEVDENDTGIRQDIPQHRPSSAPGVQENLPGLGSLRQWVYTHHLAALRHHTTLKFLAWRRHLPTLSIQSPMESSQDSGSYRHQRKALLAPPHQHQGLQSVNTFSSDSGSGYRPTISTGTYSSPPAISVTHHFQGQNNHQSCPRTALLPTEALGDLRVHDQKRISDKMVRMLETQGQVFERILQERRAAWQKALEGMEREQRIEFLMQELRKWANEGPSQKPQQHGIDDNTDDTSQRHRKLDVQYREGSRDSEWSGVTGVGLGLDAVIGVEQPSLRDALLEPFANEVSNSVRAATAMSTDRAKTKSKSRSKRGNGYKERGGSSKKNRSTFSSTISEEHADTLHEEGDEDTDDDPLGLGLWISRMFGAVGNGLVNIIVMLGMGSVATWLYTHFLEERVTWIG
ncbi:hypothetical protein FBU30_009185 [Linnemannia zychae]|nr:hypothetical protein FBU30_009185 [Linnemannia zychae]